MKLTPVDHGVAVMPAHSAPRAAGLHISDIYNRLYAELEPARYGGTDGPHETKMAMGLAWEDYLEARFADVGIDARRPGEFKTQEGIAFNPDLLIDGADRVGEVKLTYMSERDAIGDPKFSKWLTQVKAYCHHLEIPRARVYALFVNGNYRASRDPVLRAYDLEFSAAELRDNWRALMNFATSRGLL